MLVHVMHASLQHGDSRSRQRSDLEKIFGRAQDRNVAWVTGTETTHPKLIELVNGAAVQNGYRLWSPASTGRPDMKNGSWIAVREDFFAPGSWRQDYQMLVPSSREVYRKQGVSPRGRIYWNHKGLVTVSGEHPTLGIINICTAHYLMRRVNRQDLNKKIAQGVGDWARVQGRGRRLCFYHGDQNLPDNKTDTFFGEPMTSLWDELGRHPNTGHGNIDVIASYNRDGRVTGAYCRALNDTRFHLHTDHFLVEGGFEIKEL